MRVARIVIPSVVVASPLLAISFKGDQEWWMYVLFSQTGGNLGSIFASTIRDVGGFLSFGNFRPLGRLLVDLEHGIMFDTAVATGIPPNVIHGFVRLATVVILALVATRLVQALCRPAPHEPATPGGQTDDRVSKLAASVFPVVLATTLVVANTQHPVVFFPFWSILSLVTVLGAAVFIASDRAIGTRWSWRGRGQRGSGWGQFAATAGLGVALSMIYELVYVAPAVGAAMVVARRRPDRHSWRDLLNSVAAARLAGLACGLGIVVVVVRLAMMVRCATEACLGSIGSSSTIAVSGLTHRVLLNRMVSGLPWAGWDRALEGIQASGSPWTGNASGLLSNAFALLMAALIVAVGPAFYREAVHHPFARAVRRRSGLGLLLVGGTIVTLPALIIGATETVHNSEQLSAGGDWRDTLFVQVGWAIAITGVLLVLLSVKRLEWRPWISRTTIGLVVLATLYSTFVTYQVNYAYSRSDHQRYGATHNNLAATAIVNFDTSHRGDSLRCRLVDDYLSGSDSIGMVVAYDRVANRLYDTPFCSQYSFQHWNGVFVDDDHSPYERENEVLLSRGITSGCSPAGIPLFCPDKLVNGRHLSIFLGRMAALGIVEQRVAGRVDPTVDLTLAYLTRLLVDASPKITPIPNPEGLFSDIEDMNLAGYAEAVYRAGVYQGCAEYPRRYCPEDRVSRDELAGFLVRIFEISDA